ncbi:uncharacterized protein B0H18DRAFT_958918 [Fomitopsis serialis]|uniref:uncharacterized protein n=1 Tax=Fomitopsis serialis TaxID=139415 RepID=UPI002008DC63|nr:uncharacterized protein B0H18DRAFT_958918 [Neoantrodia serialis]KAH9916217.1 hypothetical protein B0H18DRAFT_958918 [Neoantrodia serialis]
MASTSASSSHHALPGAAADPLKGYDDPLDANLVLAAYGRNIETRLRQAENPRLQNRTTIARLAVTLGFPMTVEWHRKFGVQNRRDIGIGFSERVGSIRTPLAISAMEEVAGNVSGDYSTRMARIKSDDGPRVFTNAWYSASPPPGGHPLPSFTGMVTSAAPGTHTSRPRPKDIAGWCISAYDVPHSACSPVPAPTRQH